MLNTRMRLLLGKQKGICKFCNKRFYWNDVLEVDHIIAKINGGSDDYENLQLIHRHCHHVKSKVDIKLANTRDSAIRNEARAAKRIGQGVIPLPKAKL
jgi:5-methylcytosine-specific restriction endonuclease McrA